MQPTNGHHALAYYDVIIIGAGPAGLACAHEFQQAGLNCLLVEKGPIANHITEYPYYMRFFSTNENLEIDHFPIGIPEERPSRQQYLKYLTDFARYHRLKIRNYCEVVGLIRQQGGMFHVECKDYSGRPITLKAAAVVAAVGAWEYPRKLDVPGSNLPKVHYRFRETHEYVGRKVLIVGGRNSAIEAALALCRSGAEVSLSYRRDCFEGRGVKYWLKPDIENRIKANEVHGYLETNVEAIDWESVTLRHANGKRITVENDFVLPMLGYDPPVGFLKRLGISVEQGSNIPRHNPETLETDVEGLFVAGVIVAGNVSGHIFIENSREHGKKILPRLREVIAKATTPASSA